MKTIDYLTKPIAVSNDIVVQETGEELLVYKLLTHKAMSLNKTVAAIWQLCDGERNIVELKDATAKVLNSSISEEVIILAIDELKLNKLVTFNQSNQSENLSPVNRRQMIKNIGLTTAVAIPLITGLIAPSASQAASSNTCTQNSDCGSACCISNTCTQFNPAGNPINGGCFVDSDCQSNCCDTGICAPACGICFP